MQAEAAQSPSEEDRSDDLSEEEIVSDTEEAVAERVDELQAETDGANGAETLSFDPGDPIDDMLQGLRSTQNEIEVVPLGPEADGPVFQGDPQTLWMIALAAIGLLAILTLWAVRGIARRREARRLAEQTEFFQPAGDDADIDFEDDGTEYDDDESAYEDTNDPEGYEQAAYDEHEPGSYEEVAGDAHKEAHDYSDDDVVHLHAPQQSDEQSDDRSNDSNVYQLSTDDQDDLQERQPEPSKRKRKGPFAGLFNRNRSDDIQDIEAADPDPAAPTDQSYGDDTAEDSSYDDQEEPLEEQPFATSDEGYADPAAPAQGFQEPATPQYFAGGAASADDALREARSRAEAEAEEIRARARRDADEARRSVEREADAMRDDIRAREAAQLQALRTREAEEERRRNELKATEERLERERAELLDRQERLSKQSTDQMTSASQLEQALSLRLENRFSDLSRLIESRLQPAVDLPARLASLESDQQGSTMSDTLAAVEDALIVQSETLSTETRNLLDSYTKRMEERIEGLARIVEEKKVTESTDKEDLGDLNIERDRFEPLVELISRRLTDHRKEVNDDLATMSKKFEALSLGAVQPTEGRTATYSSAPIMPLAAPIQLEDIVRNALPPNSYDLSARLSNNRKADCLIKLPYPPGPIAIDAQFPLDEYIDERRKALEKTETKSGDDAHSEVKRLLLRHLVDIAERLIIPNETAESALMFVPSEQVFAELHAHYADVVQDSYRARVWIVSPTSLMATLNTMRAVLRDADLRENTSLIQSEAQHVLTEMQALRARIDALEQSVNRTHQDVRALATTSDQVVRRAETITSTGRNLSEMENRGRPIISPGGATGASEPTMAGKAKPADDNTTDLSSIAEAIEQLENKKTPDA
ncbi:MAG: DNA recombination protein RmuC [Pseudomonadota bacterium]